MSLLKNASREKEFDVRIRDKNLARGVIPQDQVDKHLKTLPDDTSHAEWVNIVELEQDKSIPND